MSQVLSILNENSCPVSKLSYSNGLKPSDLLIIARLSSDIHTPFKMTYADLKARLLSDIRSRITAESMAYKDKNEYAKINHGHDYSLVEIFPQCSADDNNVYLGQFNLWKYDDQTSAYVENHISVYQPFSAVSTNSNESRYSVGEVVFTGWKKWPTESTSNPNFVMVNRSEMLYDSQTSGYWVYPHGQTITCAAGEFTDACRLYGDNGRTGSDTSFTVPDLSGFIKLNPGTNIINALDKVGFQNGLQQHSHTASTGESGNEITAALYIEQGGMTIDDPEDASGTDVMPHAAGKNLKSSKTQTTDASYKKKGKWSYTSETFNYFYYSNHKLKYTISDAKYVQADGHGVTDSMDIVERETYPSHIVMPVILYIGGK